MRIRQSLALLLVTGCMLGTRSAASTGPDDRPITDPKSVVSSSNSAARPAPIDDLYYTRSIFAPAWSPNGRQIAFVSDIAGRFNLWKVGASGGWPIQLTQSDDRQYSPVWSPDGKWIVYEQDRGGDELWDLYAVPSEGGEIINLTNTPAIREQDPHWSHDGRTIAFSYKPKEASQYDIALLDWNTRKVQKLTHEEQPGYFWSVVTWSSDDKTIYAGRVNASFTDADIYRIDVATGKTENLTGHQGTVRYFASSLSPDGRTLLLSSDAKGGYMNVGLLDIATKKMNWVTDLRWEASSGNFSPDGKHYTYTVNQDGVTDAYLVDRATNDAKKVDLPHGLIIFRAARASSRRRATV
jgi:Tol biopolymer transport system component